MIYTVTLNPSIDFVVRINSLNLGKTNRAVEDQKFPGGKGIMVSKLLSNIGTPSVNLGFIGGKTGEYIIDELNKLDIKYNFVKILEDSRINVKLKSDTETEINTLGPIIDENSVDEFFKVLSQVRKDDIIIFSGSLPRGVDEDFYIECIKRIKSLGADFTIDTNSKQMLKSFEYNPILIKPNLEELENLFNVKLNDINQILKYAKKCILNGCKNVIVSLGSKGAIYTNGEKSYFSKAIKGNVINTVGAGDSMVAAFVGYIGNGIETAFKYSIAAATATAFSKDVGDNEDILKYYSMVELEEI